MPLRDLIGQDRPVELLRRTLRSGRVPHAFLFHGPEGVGKGTAAVEFACALLCGTGGDDACGTCGACRRARTGSHPDSFLVTRQPKRGSGSGSKESSDLSPFIVVDQIREMTAHASFAPTEGRYRVFRIEPADAMNDEAQNALLKTLEEPASTTVLLLVAERPNVLLPTVRSRCLAIRFGEVPLPAIETWLRGRGVSDEEIAPRAALSSGRPGRALDLDLESLQARRKGLLEDLEELAASPEALARLSDRVGRLSGSGETEFLEGLAIVQGLLRDAARSASGLTAGALSHSDLSDRIDALGERLGADRAAALVEAVDRCRSYTRFHVNRTLITETILAAVAGGPLP